MNPKRQALWLTVNGTAPADQGDTCTWNLEHGVSDWSGQCGIYWSFVDDGPQENGVKFCPKCGRTCVFVEPDEGQDDE